MNAHVHPLFAEILNDVALQPTLLHRAQVKAAPRRFSGEPPSAFAEFVPTPEDRAQWAREDADEAWIDEREAEVLSERGQ